MHLRFATTTLAIFTVGTLCLNGEVRADATTQPAATMPTAGPTTGPVVIKWEEAAKHVGEIVTITGPVKGTHVTTGSKSLVLNVGQDFPDPKRFSIMIATDPQTPAKPEDYQDKTVTVTGKIEMYRKVAEMKIAKPADVMIAKE